MGVIRRGLRGDLLGSMGGLVYFEVGFVLFCIYCMYAF